jgi:uncharacterized membrane protein
LILHEAFIIIFVMQESNSDRSWSVTLTPHRSLKRQGFVAIMVLVAIINFIGGVLFMVVGAWPVTGFMGLDVLLVWWAFRQNFADAQKAERISVENDIVKLQRFTPEGQREVLEYNRRWLRVELEIDDARDLVGRLLFSYRGAFTEVGSFLGAEERRTLSKALREALA